MAFDASSSLSEAVFEVDPATLRVLAAALEADPAGAHDLLDGKVERALDKSARSTAKRMKRDVRVTLSAHRAYRDDFERRLANTWKKALDLYDITMIACRDAGAILNARYRPEAAARQDVLFEALTMVHARACVIASEVRTLIGSGHPGGAHARQRALHEHAVIASVLREGGADTAERFLLHRHVEAAKDAEFYQQHCEHLGEDPLSDEEVGAIYARLDELRQRYGAVYTTDWGWAASLMQQPTQAPSFVHLERIAGLTHLRPYYRWASKAVHAGSKGVTSGLTTRGPHRAFLAGPTNAGLADPAQGALISFGQVTTAYLLNGSERLHDPAYVVIPMALMQLVDEAAHAFVDAQRRLEERERKLWA